MKKYFNCALLLFFSSLFVGCSSTADVSKYYILEGIDLDNNSRVCDTKCRKVRVEVSVPDFLNSNGIVYYSENENRIRMSMKNLWIEQLDIQLKNIIENKINILNKSYYAYDSRIDIEADVSLHIFINDFNGNKDGKAVISGTFLYKNGDIVNYGNFYKEEFPENNGFQSLIDKLNSMWLDECDVIINKLL